MTNLDDGIDSLMSKTINEIHEETLDAIGNNDLELFTFNYGKLSGMKQTLLMTYPKSDSYLFVKKATSELMELYADIIK